MGLSVLKPKEEDGAAQAQHRRNLTPNKKPAKNLIFGGCKFYFDVKSAASITKPYYEVIQSCGGVSVRICKICDDIDPRPWHCRQLKSFSPVTSLT